MIKKFFLLIIIVIIILFWIQFFSIYSDYKIDTNSYVILIKWNATISNNSWKKIIKLNEKNQIFPWDIITTFENSLAVIEWWDKSITRLDWWTEIKIWENFVSEDLTKINISFNLLKWKTWSNIITIMWNDSYFEQEVKWSIAAVRGTVFEVNYENDYIRTIEHEINLKNINWETIILKENEMFSLKESIIKDLKDLIDNSWEILNKKLDKEYFEKLTKELLMRLGNNNIFEKLFNKQEKFISMLKKWEDFDKINDYLKNLKEKDREELLWNLKTINQMINFEKWENKNLYNIKLLSKNLLIDNVNDLYYKENLIKYSMYDLKNILRSNSLNEEIIKSTLDFLKTNEKYVDYTTDKFKSFSNFIIKWQNINFSEFMHSINNVREKWENFIINQFNNLFKK